MSVLSSVAQPFESLPDLDADLDEWYNNITDDIQTPILKGIYFYSDATKPISKDQNPFYKEVWDLNGTVSFEGRQYDEINVSYNIKNDYLLIRNWDMDKTGEKSLLINQAKIDSFRIHGEKFVRSTHLPLSETGFYTEVMKGQKVSCYARKRKISVDDGLEVKYKEKIAYYVIYQNRVHAFKNKSSFKKIFPAHKKSIKEFTKSNLGAFEKGNESHLEKVLKYCDLVIE